MGHAETGPDPARTGKLTGALILFLGLMIVRGAAAPLTTITIALSGLGTVSPNYTNALLQVGKLYTVTARPGKGYVFSNWLDQAGDVLATTPALRFTMASNLFLTATFVPNPFLPVKGSYAGLFFDTNGVTATNAGSFGLTLTDQGKYSSKLQFANASYSLSGQFSLTGMASNSVVRHGQDPLITLLQLDFAGTNHLTGAIAESNWTAQIDADRLVYSRTNPAVPATQKYTLLFPGWANPTNRPGGYGYGIATVDSLGNITFSGTLSDGAKATQRTFLSPTREWPLFSSIYAGKGLLEGWLRFTNDIYFQVPIDVVGMPEWIKLPQRAAFYPNGFSSEGELTVIGQSYAQTNGQAPLTWTNGAALLEDGNLVQTITNDFAFTSGSRAAGPNNFKLSLSASTGVFQGSVLNPPTRKTINFGGVILQRIGQGYGFFLGTNQSGTVFFGTTD